MSYLASAGEAEAATVLLGFLSVGGRLMRDDERTANRVRGILVHKAGAAASIAAGAEPTTDQEVEFALTTLAP